MGLDLVQGSIRSLSIAVRRAVHAYGLRESETISRQLEDLYPDGSTEVLNFGVSPAGGAEFATSG